MKKKALLVLLLALVISAIITIPSLAASSKNEGKPIYYDGTLVAGKEYFFANGVEITIEAPESGDGALIKWEGGSQQVGKEAYIFGGMHDDDTEVSTSITMNGGTVKNIFGGGLHLSNTVESNVIIKDGTVTSVMGGGASSLTNACGCTNGTTWHAGDGKTSPCKTETANVTIDGGTVKSLVFGGGEGISYTGTANLTINDGNLENAWVTGGGSNGHTGTVNVIINGGTINVVQSVNRGTVDEATVVAFGGTIEKLYAGGESPESTPGDVVNAYITTRLRVGVAGTAEVENMYLGSNGNEDLVISDEEDSVFTSEDIVVVPTTVTNLNGINKEEITVAYQIVIDEKLYFVQEGQTVEDIEGYEKIIVKEGYTFKGFKDGDKDFDISTKIEDNYVLTTVFDKVVEEDDEEDKTEPGNSEDDKEEGKDDVPRTGIGSTMLTASTVVAVISLAGLAIVKKERK